MKLELRPSSLTSTLKVSSLVKIRKSTHECVLMHSASIVVIACHKIDHRPHVSLYVSSLSVGHYELCRDDIGGFTWKPRTSLTKRKRQ